MMSGRAQVPCGTCKACCRQEVVMLVPERGDDVASYEHVSVEMPGGSQGHFLKRTPSGDCVHLGDHGCTIHERAPVVCRDFDCRMYFLSMPRTRRRLLQKASAVDTEIFAAGRERLDTLPPAQRAVAIGMRSMR